MNKTLQAVDKNKSEIRRPTSQTDLWGMTRTGMPTVVDLFSGCGGLSYGFIKAGYQVLLGVDNDAASLETFKKNHPGSRALNTDLSKDEAIEEIRRELLGRNADFVIAGPPCQGFSLTGTRNFDDPRNGLYLSVFRYVSELKPLGFVIENVKGMKALYQGRVMAEVLRRFDNLGYDVSVALVNAADFGVPQIRQRLIFVGLQKDIGSFQFPKHQMSDNGYLGCQDAIGDLPSREDELGNERDSYSQPPITPYQHKMRNGCEVLFNHVATRHTDLVKNVIALVPEGGNYKDLPAGVGQSRRFNEAWTRYHSKQPSRTIDTGHRNHFHYRYNRVPTIRENARLQSFPDSFVFFGTKTEQNRQVGNAVPPLLGEAIGRQILRCIR